METASMNTLIDDFYALLLKTKSMRLTLLKKTLAEVQRDVIFSSAQTAEQNFIKGTMKRGNFQDLQNNLEND